MSKPRLLDLFCGAGGAAMGYHRAGFEVVGVDIKLQPNYPFDFVQADALVVLAQDDRDDSIRGTGLELIGEVKRVPFSHCIPPVVSVSEHEALALDSIDADHQIVVHGSSLGDGDSGILNDSGAGCEGGDGDTFLPSPALESFDAIHASPPCQAYSAMSWHPQNQSVEHPDLIEPIRDFLEATELPWVIENVDHAPLLNPIRLCGSSFGLPIRRHRLFETNWPLMGPPCAHGQQKKIFKVWRHGETILSRVVPIYGTGGGKASEHWAAALEIDWMTRPEMAEAIPPAYTELIGHQLMQHLEAKVAA